MESFGQIAAAFHEESPTCHVCVRTIKGKRRVLSIPNDGMRHLHQQLLVRLRKLDGSEFKRTSYGVGGTYSAVDNALRHLKHRYLYQLDISNAYAAVSEDRLARVLYARDPSLGTLPEIFMFLVEYCSGIGGGLGTGLPASPFLFDYYCGRVIDPVLLELHPELTYTRYLDDLTFSSPQPITRAMRKSIREVVVRAGFNVNHSKSRRTDRQERSVTITGVTITRRGEVRPTTPHLDRLFALLAIRPEDASSTHAHMIAGSVGMIEELLRVRPHVRVSPDAVMLRHRAKQRIRQLAKRGLFGERPPRPAPFDPLYLQSLQAHIPVSEVVQHYLPDTVYREVGTELYLLCPYHNEKTPSFSICDEKQFYHCFGCGAHGDIYRFVQEREECDFRQAVHILVNRFGEPRKEKRYDDLWLF
ncbi:MAG: hypothetical protein JWL75_456 [Parcubacteria group bacterium]|nr:hypothetical protein [Parcubacteria group bacterium]